MFFGFYLKDEVIEVGGGCRILWELVGVGV